MKEYLFICFIGVFICSFLIKVDKGYKQKDKMFLAQIFNQDSGYIKKNEVLKLLLLFKLTNTINCTHWVDSCYNPWHQFEVSDTLGKYYKNSHTDSYTAFVYGFPNGVGMYQVLDIDIKK